MTERAGLAPEKPRAEPCIVSEKFSEKKRGRPKVMPEDFEAFMFSIGGFERNGTRRGQLNTYYFSMGLRLFKDAGGKIDAESAKRWGWLHRDTLDASGDGNVRKTIVSEIGRFRDLAIMAQVADRICELKPTTRKAVRMLRRWRGTRRGKPASSEGLFLAMARAFDDYRATHPDVTPNDAHIALVELSDVLSDILCCASDKTARRKTSRQTNTKQGGAH